MNTGFLLMSVAKKLKYQLNKKLQKRDVTVQQWSVIKNIELLSNEQLVTSVELAMRLDIDKPTISGIINRLEDKKLIKKLAHPTDKRASVLELTEDGKELLLQCQNLSEEVLDSYMSVLDFDEKEQLKKILLKMDRKEEQ